MKTIIFGKNKRTWLDADFSVKSFKQRAMALKKALEPLGLIIPRAKVLHVCSALEGFSSFGALKVQLERDCPAFCPHCGKAGALTLRGRVSCANTRGDEDGYDEAGDGFMYQCNQCTARFTDWSEDFPYEPGLEEIPSDTYCVTYHAKDKSLEDAPVTVVAGEGNSMRARFADGSLLAISGHDSDNRPVLQDLVKDVAIAVAQATRALGVFEVAVENERTGEGLALEAEELESPWEGKGEVVGLWVLYSAFEGAVVDGHSGFWSTQHEWTALENARLFSEDELLFESIKGTGGVWMTHATALKLVKDLGVSYDVTSYESEREYQRSSGSSEGTFIDFDQAVACADAANNREGTYLVVILNNLNGEEMSY